MFLSFPSGERGENDLFMKKKKKNNHKTRTINKLETQK